MPKSRKATDAAGTGQAARWTIYKLGKKAKWLGYVEAASEPEAIDRACEQFKIPKHDRFRISAKRD